MNSILVNHLHHHGHQYLVLTPEIQYRRGSFLIEIEPKLFNLLWQTSSHIELERERQKQTIHDNDDQMSAAKDN